MGPNEYPDSWRTSQHADPVEAVALAVESFVAALDDADLNALLARTRGGAR